MCFLCLLKGQWRDSRFFNTLFLTCLLLLYTTHINTSHILLLLLIISMWGQLHTVAQENSPTKQLQPLFDLVTEFPRRVHKPNSRTGRVLILIKISNIINLLACVCLVSTILDTFLPVVSLDQETE